MDIEQEMDDVRRLLRWAGLGQTIASATWGAGVASCLLSLADLAEARVLWLGIVLFTCVNLWSIGPCEWLRRRISRKQDAIGAELQRRAGETVERAFANIRRGNP